MNTLIGTSHRSLHDSLQRVHIMQLSQSSKFPISLIFNQAIYSYLKMCSFQTLWAIRRCISNRYFGLVSKLRCFSVACKIWEPAHANIDPRWIDLRIYNPGSIRFEKVRVHTHLDWSQTRLDWSQFAVERSCTFRSLLSISDRYH